MYALDSEEFTTHDSLRTNPNPSRQCHEPPVQLQQKIVPIGAALQLGVQDRG